MAIPLSTIRCRLLSRSRIVHRFCLNFARVIFALTLVFSSLLCKAALEAPPLPAAEDVIVKLLDRAKSISSDTNRTRYVYLKTLETEELDDSGRVKSKKEQLYEVKLIGGMPHPRLIRVNGRSLGKEEISKENDSQENTRRSITSQKRPGRREMVISEDLLSRFQYSVEGRELLLGRDTLIVSFKPKATRLPEKRIADRVINKLCGRVWIDEQDFELARIDLRLTEEVTLWGGVLGSLKELSMVMDRDRLPTGVWFNKKGVFTIQGRKLFSSLRMRARETASKIRAENAHE